MTRLILDNLLKSAKHAVILKKLYLEKQARREMSAELYIAQTESTEGELESKIIPVVDRQVEDIVKGLYELEETKASQDAPTVIQNIHHPKEWTSEYVDVILPVLASGMAETIIAQMMTLAIDPRLKNPKRIQYKATTATEWLENNPESEEELSKMLMGIEGFPVQLWTELPVWMKTEIAAQLTISFQQPYWQSIAETTMGDAETALRMGLENGWSIRKIASEMRESLGGDGYAMRRAMTIARTESSNALNGARKAASDRLKRDLPPLGIKRFWMSILSVTTRDSHAALDGVPEDSEGLWLLGGMRIPWPGYFTLPASLRINCYCSTYEDFGVSNEEAQALIQDYYGREESQLTTVA